VFSPNQRIPDSRSRNDARQGTIDQDPDFQNFLQTLTTMIQKPATVDAEGPAKKEPVKTTPLIEAIREKKAAKEKPSKGASKHGRHDPKDPKSDKSEKKAGGKVGKEILASPDKGKRMSKADRAAKEAVKVLNREASGTAQGSEKSTSGPGPSSAERQRERVAKPISVAAIIQRDLGRAPAGGRRGKREAALSETSNSQGSVDAPALAGQTNTPSPKDPKASRNRRLSKSTTGDKSSADTSPDVLKKPPTGPAQPTILKKAPAAVPPKGPANRAPPTAPKANNIPTALASTTSESAASSAPNTPTTPSSTGRQAFLKHANPSQGITEPLIEEALKVFGVIDKVEIDRKKGFAYVDFADSDGLRKAVAASPIKVAQGAVQVLERRDRALPRAPAAAMAPRGGAGFRGGRGGRGRGRGGLIGGGPASARNDPSVPSTNPSAGNPAVSSPTVASGPTT
jgi:regulator of nonsense transcripts 3